MKALRLLILLLVSLPAYARTVVVAPGGFYGNTWQQAQFMHLQTQQQLQAQDLYRRQLLMQDQERQLNKLEDLQLQNSSRLNSLMMHEYSDRLKLYSRPLRGKVK